LLHFFLFNELILQANHDGLGFIEALNVLVSIKALLIEFDDGMTRNPVPVV